MLWQPARLLAHLTGRSKMNDPATEQSVDSTTESPSPESPATDSTEQTPPLPLATPEQEAARDYLERTVAALGAAIERVTEAGLDPLVELQATGFALGGALPPVDMGGPGDETATALGHVPDGQLPPV